MALAQPVTPQSSNTRERILDAVEDLMVERGYAAATYRAIAGRADVSPSNVQYYFPTLDELLVATVRRRTEQSLAHLAAMLEARPHEPLRVLWEFGADETTATLAFEFSALGNHRESVRAETTGYMGRLRSIQLDALSRAEHLHGITIPHAALIFLLTGLPKLMKMEKKFDIDVGHREVSHLVTAFLDTNEAR